jgi:hypothetical protein
MSVKEKPTIAVATSESIRFTSDVLPFQKNKSHSRRSTATKLARASSFHDKMFGFFDSIRQLSKSHSQLSQQHS